MIPPVLDERIFARFCMILKEKSSKHIEMLKTGCADLVCQIKQNDVEAVIFNAHKLKSSSGQMGAKALSHSILQLEQKVVPLFEVTEGDRQAALEQAQHTMSAMVDDLEQLIADTLVALNETCAQQSNK